MSEHIQPAPSPHGVATPAAEETYARTPGVAHEREYFDLRLIVRVGVGLVVTGIVIHFAVGWLLEASKKYEAAPPEKASELALEDANRPLSKRLNDMPPPHLEGIERESSLLVLRTGAGEESRFFTARGVHVRIADRSGTRTSSRLFDLREGQEVSITYYVPGGVEGAYGVVTHVSSPPEKEPTKAAQELADADRTLIGTVVRLEPRSVEAAREWATAQMDRYGWADREKGVARIPVKVAMEEVLRSKEFRPADKKKGDGHIAPPGRSNSGRGREGDGR